jgi:hypothetical protein
MGRNVGEVDTNDESPERKRSVVVVEGEKRKKEGGGNGMNGGRVRRKRGKKVK